MENLRSNLHKKLRIYRTLSGKEPFSAWLNELKDISARSRIRARLDRVATGNFGDSKSISKDIKELRMTFGPGYRIYFTELGDTIVILLCGGSKRSQKRDIEKAKEYFDDLRCRNESE